jgi:hypothetical protein
VAALLAVGGLALAQDGLIVDPWKHGVSALFAAPPPVSHTPTRAVGVASLPAAKPRTDAPAVVPVGPPLVDAPVDPWVTLSFGPVAPTDTDGIVDPWADSPARADAASRHAASDWAFRIREIVDPWARGPVAVAQRDPLIIDPWAPRH